MRENYYLRAGVNIYRMVLRSSVTQRNLYNDTPRTPPLARVGVELCGCEPAFSCPGGVMVYSGLEGMLTPLYTRMQNGWCCRRSQ